MLAYITIGTNDFQRAVNFYDAIFNVLGYSRLPAWTDSWAMWGNGTMFAFRANSAEIVRRFHAAGLRAGGKDEGVPGTRTAYGPDFYVAYLRDPDGHKLACVCQHYSPDADKLSGEEESLH